MGTQDVAVSMPRDIAAYLERRQFPGETMWDAVRRLLNLAGGHRHQQLRACLARGLNSTERLLLGFQFLHAEDPDRFGSVAEHVRGHKRPYFARENGIGQWGRSAQPRRIPGTPFWVLTNLSTERKRKIFDRVLRAFGFEDDAVRKDLLYALRHGLKWRIKGL